MNARAYSAAFWNKLTQAKRFNLDNVVIWLVPLALVVFICTMAVNTPFWDDWELVPILQHVSTGHWYFHDFWQQHNEHRPFFPTIVLVLLALGTHWNSVLICLVSLAIAIGGFLVLQRVVWLSAEKEMALTISLLLSVIWFSTDQTENWLWGWQVEWFMNTLGVMLVTYGIARIKTVLTRRLLVLIITGAILAQFSLGNGVLLWPLVILALVYLRTDWRRIAAVFGIGCVTTIFYYVHYVNPSGPPKSFGLHHPFSLLAYIFVYLGRSFTPLYNPALLLGIMSVGLYIVAVWWLMYRHRAGLCQALPWLLLGAYAIASGVITGLARVGLGTREALSSRYATVSGLLLISLIMLVWQQRYTLGAWRGILKGRGPTIAISLLYVLVIFNALWGLHTGMNHHRQLEASKSCTTQQLPTDACLFQTYPDPAIVAPRVETLKTMHYAGY